MAFLGRGDSADNFAVRNDYFLLAPLVQVAWAEGKVTSREKRVVLDIANESGVTKVSPSYALLEEWLEKRPPPAVFEAAVEAIRIGLSVLPENERAARCDYK